MGYQVDPDMRKVEILPQTDFWELIISPKYSVIPDHLNFIAKLSLSPSSAWLSKV